MHYRPFVVTVSPRPSGQISYQPPNIGALYLESSNHHYGSREERKRGLQAIRRQLEGRNPESLAYAFCGMFPQSGSVFIFMPRIPIAQNGCLADIDPRPPLQATPVQATGTSPFLGIFPALPRPAFGLYLRLSTRRALPVNSGLAAGTRPQRAHTVPKARQTIQYDRTNPRHAKNPEPMP